MRSQSMRSLMILMVAWLAGCAAAELPKPYVASEPVDGKELKFYLEPSTGLDAETVRSACAVWAPEGVTCTAVAAVNEAHVLVRVNDAPCREIGDDMLGLATSTFGVIRVEAGCMRETVGLDAGTYLRVLAHEFGHQLGIKHVPGSGEAALMSPILSEVWYMTDLDHRAYMDHGPSVLDYAPGPPTGTTTSE